MFNEHDSQAENNLLGELSKINLFFIVVQKYFRRHFREFTVN